MDTWLPAEHLGTVASAVPVAGLLNAVAAAPLRAPRSGPPGHGLLPAVAAAAR